MPSGNSTQQHQMVNIAVTMIFVIRYTVLVYACHDSIVQCSYVALLMLVRSFIAEGDVQEHCWVARNNLTLP